MRIRRTVMAPRGRETYLSTVARHLLSRQCRWRRGWGGEERYIGQERKTTFVFSPSLIFPLSHLTFTRFFATSPLDHRLIV